MRLKLLSGAFISLLWSGQAFAVSVDGYSDYYGGVLFTQEMADDARKTNGTQRDDNAQGAQVFLGMTLGASKQTALELSYYDIGRDRSLDGGRDFRTGLNVGLTYDFGLFGWRGEDNQARGVTFKPFVLGGVGVVNNDVLGEESFKPNVEAGFGVLFPLFQSRMSLRLQSRAVYQFDDETRYVTRPDKLLDYDFQAGLQVSYGSVAAPVAPVEPVVEDACPTAVVDPATGRKDCAIDSDRDSVPDSADQCPATPAGTSVNAQGCPALDTTPAPVEAPPASDVGRFVPVQQINFKSNSAILTEDSKEALKTEVVAKLYANPKMRVEVGGHADSAGSEAYNIVLSLQRAEAVRQFLLSKGIEGGRITTMPYGEFRGFNSPAPGKRAVSFKFFGESDSEPTSTAKAAPAASEAKPEAKSESKAEDSSKTEATR